MALRFMYITNNVEIAHIAEQAVRTVFGLILREEVKKNDKGI